MCRLLQLNTITINNNYPLLSIEYIIDKLQGATWFYKIDFRFGYHQLRVRKSDMLKTTIRTIYGHYEFLVMSIRLTNAPKVFMDLMNIVLKLYVDMFVILFIDDILIYSRNEEVHASHFKIHHQTFMDRDLYAKFLHVSVCFSLWCS